MLFLCDTSSPSEPCSLILQLLCFIDVILNFIFSLILNRFLFKFLLLLRCKLLRVCCQMPSCSVLPLSLSLPEKRLVHLPPSSFSPHVFPIFRLCSKLPSHLWFFHRGEVEVLISLWHRLSPWPSSLLSVLPSAVLWPLVRFSESSLPCFKR